MIVFSKGNVSIIIRRVALEPRGVVLYITLVLRIEQRYLHNTKVYQFLTFNLQITIL